MTWKLNQGMLYYNEFPVETSYDDYKDIELKVSPDKKYAAICNIHDYYTDLYKVNYNDEPEYLYSLRRNTYRTEGTKYLLEFFTSPKNPEDTLFIFNKEHGVISVCDAETGKTLHTDEPEDKFITDYKIIDNKYIYLIGWYWTPIHFTALYKINDLLQHDGYQSVKIDHEPIDTDKEFVFKLNEDNIITFCNKNHHLYKEFSLDDFYENHKTITKINKDIELCINIVNNKNNLFHKICNENYSHVEFVNDARQVLLEMLNKELTYEENDIIRATCIGNKTGSDLSYHLWKFASNVEFDDTTLNYLVPKVMTHGWTKKIASLTQITMTISMMRNDKTIKIVMNQELTLMPESYLHHHSNYDLYEVDEKKPCYIVVSYENNQ